ncbi:peptidase C14 caspase catalytic subunit p20 [Desulfobulbus propionicus DSM 2032]|uniref:Peptidase C14 caspase catalytic subunit p20 n=1 Tax=Desulfobulbus propionicus (strain ATCC 33891 / DSM 2032 / VKM B-1956 / 1pr3) TaxID=577650 RepID=A0A7U3YL06_DESPD|nr:caspase family protein [Desulfobulbus propionicus]ADW17331.1 peptidase C14 caspase catalytic subunit p20 [Desulfobulbus propionicus DSM 2032]
MSKKALCIGINDYPGTQNDLSGCVNDANDWAAELTARGFTVDKLLDAAATKAAMVAAIGGLIDGAAKGDSLIFTYSGHGTWVPDRSGDEPDGRDEALCPHDLATKGALLDDDIHALFSRRKAGVRIVLISDSCHSGSVTRGSEEDIDPGVPRIRFMPPEAWMAKEDLPPAQLRAAIPRGGFTRAGGDLLLAGCLDTEYSYDTRFNGRPNGAFTFYALKALREAKPTSYEKWFNAIRAYLPSTRLPQTPQIFGTKTARRFKIFQ